MKKKREKKKGWNGVFASPDHSDNSRVDILDEHHRYWRAFFTRLTDTLRIKDCNHTFDIAQSILHSLPNVDGAGTLDFFMANGGYCDCEILFNVYEKSKIFK